MSQPTQISASNCVGQVAVQPLQTKANNGFGSCVMAKLYSSLEGAGKSRENRITSVICDARGSRADRRWYRATWVQPGAAHSQARVAPCRSTDQLPASLS